MQGISNRFLTQDFGIENVYSIDIVAPFFFVNFNKKYYEYESKTF